MFSVRDESTGKTKHAGRSVAKVIDNVDPKKSGRIRVFHPLIGESNWIDYQKLPGQFWVPEIGELVYLEADAGSIEFPTAWGNLTMEDDAFLPEVFKRSNPTNRGLYTKGGHLLELDDGTGITGLESKGVRLTTSGGKKFHLTEDLLAQDNKMLLEDENGDKIEIDVITSKITVTTANGSIMTMDGISDSIITATAFGDIIEASALNGIQLTTPAVGGTSTSMKAGKVNTKGALQFSAEDGAGAKLNLANGLVALGNSAGELFDLLDQQQDILIALTTSMATETHIGNLGYNSSPPVNATDYVKANVDITTKIKAKIALIKGSL